jgi:hypothetical protein
MKEYKVIMPSLGFRKRAQKLEDILNNHAREGWRVATSNFAEVFTIVLERDKNR